MSFAWCMTSATHILLNIALKSTRLVVGRTEVSLILAWSTGYTNICSLLNVMLVRNIIILLYLNCLAYNWKVWGGKVFWKVFYASQSCISLIKNTEKQQYWEILQLKINVFNFNIILNVICSCDGTAEFSAATSHFFSVTWSSRNHSNLLIWCSRNIKHKTFLLRMLKTIAPNIFVETVIHFFKFLFLNIVNVFTVIFDQFNVSLLNKISPPKNSYWPHTFKWNLCVDFAKWLISF